MSAFDLKFLNPKPFTSYNRRFSVVVVFSIELYLLLWKCFFLFLTIIFFFKISGDGNFSITSN